MPDDWFGVAVRTVEAAAGDVHKAVDDVVELLRKGAPMHSDGAPVSVVVTGLTGKGWSREARLAPTLAYDRFEAAVTAYRARAIRALVDDEGLTFTDVGRLTGVSRQMVARLYRSVEE